MKVEQILQSKGTEVYSVHTNDQVAKAVSTMNDKNIGAVLVKNDSEEVVGILSERDVVRQISGGGATAMSTQVAHCMSKMPVSCTRESTVAELMTEMTTRRIRHMPVIENGALLGMVSIGDVVKRKIEETEQEAAALKEYITS